MRHKAQQVLLIVLLSFMMSGCATLGAGLEAPSINLVGIRLEQIKGFEATFQVDLRVINPNGTALPVQGIDCDLSLNGKHLAKGVANPQKAIPAYGTQVVTVDVYASLLSMVGVAHSLVQGTQGTQTNEKISYGIEGNLSLAGNTWPGKIPFDAKGQIDLTEIVAKPDTR